MSKKDPYEGTLQYGLSPQLVQLLESTIKDMNKGSVPQSDQELLDLVSVAYKLGVEITTMQFKHSEYVNRKR